MNRREFLKAMAWSAIGLSTARCAAGAGWVLHDYYRHIQRGIAPGIDFHVSSSPPYTEIVPCAAGWVWDTGFEDSIGEYITVTHGLSYYTMYAHLKERFVTEGSPVERNQVMAIGGNTGQNARGVWHLHLGVLVPEYAWDSDFQSPGAGLRWANPDALSESGKRLDLWRENDLDTAFQNDVKEAVASIEALWNFLPDGQRIAQFVERRESLTFDRTLTLIERTHKRCSRCVNSKEAPDFFKRVERLKSLRPTLTLPFPNPALGSGYVRPLRRSS